MIKERDPLRPKRLADYVGQNQIKDVLTTAMEAAKGRNEPLDHVLLNGPPGLGKTTLANIIANEMGWNIQPIIGTTLSNVPAARVFLVGMEAKSMLFIDEVHRMRRPIQELFYPVLEDGELQFDGARLKLDHPTTVIAATTQIGKLEQPFIDRFPLQFQMDYYPEEDLVVILENSAKKLKVCCLEEEELEVIAARARGTPRIANNLLRRIRDYVEVSKKDADVAFVEEVLWEKMRIDACGLDATDRLYLQILERYTDGVGVDTIATEMGQSIDTLEDYIEPFMLRLGFIERRRNGRWITEKAKSHLEAVRSTSRQLMKAMPTSQ